MVRAVFKGVGIQLDVNDRVAIDAVGGPNWASGVARDVFESGGEVLHYAVVAGELTAACSCGDTGVTDRPATGRCCDGVDCGAEQRCCDGCLPKIEEGEVVAAAGVVVVVRHAAPA